MHISQEAETRKENHSFWDKKQVRQSNNIYNIAIAILYICETTSKATTCQYNKQ